MNRWSPWYISPLGFPASSYGINLEHCDGISRIVRIERRERNQQVYRQGAPWGHESHVKKDWKELKLNTYTNNVNLFFFFCGSIIGTSELSVLSLKKFYVGWPLGNFPRIYVSEEKHDERFRVGLWRGISF